MWQAGMVFAPLTTERLSLRRTRLSDTQAWFERRSDPEVAELQDWPMPYPLERAQARLAELEQMNGPELDSWWALTIADRDDTTIYGDLVIKLENDGHTAEVGYTLSREHWGNGYASEALNAVVDWLIDEQGVGRVSAMLHPDNARSARLLESCGFVFEGHLRASYWAKGDPEDDLIYGLTPAMRRSWIDRPRHAPDNVELLEPYPTGLRNVVALGTHRSQEAFVSPIVSSLAQVAVPPFQEDETGALTEVRIEPWARIVHADDEPVGFVMLAKPNAVVPDAYLWRLLIDRMHQRRGIGGRVVEMAIEQARAWETSGLLVSWVPGVGSPEPLYRSMGFEPTGKIHDGEIEARLPLT